MKFNRHAVLATAAAALLAATPMVWAITAQQAVQVMQNNGYVAPHDLEKEHGYWKAKTVTQAGERARVLVSDADSSFLAIRNGDIGSKLPSAAQVSDKLLSMGYTVIQDLEFDDGFWEAEVRQTRRSEKVDLVLHPVSLQVLNQTSAAGGVDVLSAAQITQRLQQAGYTQIRDLEFDDGRWEAEAYNAAKQPVELYINAATGAVEREKLDD